jgi:hypothetical protein
MEPNRRHRYKLRNNGLRLGGQIGAVLAWTLVRMILSSAGFGHGAAANAPDHPRLVGRGVKRIFLLIDRRGLAPPFFCAGRAGRFAVPSVRWRPASPLGCLRAPLLQIRAPSRPFDQPRPDHARARRPPRKQPCLSRDGRTPWRAPRRATPRRARVSGSTRTARIAAHVPAEAARYYDRAPLWEAGLAL